MAIITGSWILDFGFFISTLFFSLYLFYLHRFNFWKKVNVVHTNPGFPFADLKGVGSVRSAGEMFRDLYDQHKHLPYLGMWMFFKPNLLINDPELIKTIFVKEFATFQDRGMYANEKDPLSAHLFTLGGSQWRNLRVKLTPTFTSGKMKMMFPLIMECSEELKIVLQEPARKREMLEMKEISARFTTDVISSCAFGLQTNSLKNPDAVFRHMGQRITEPSIRNMITTTLLLFFPSIAYLINWKVMPRDIAEFFMGAVRDTMKYREENNVKRNDFLQLLIQLIKIGKLEDVDKLDIGEQEASPFTFEQAAGQAFVFFTAGFETSATVMQFLLYELALNTDIQEKTREDIQRVLDHHEGKITYEGIHEMSYLGRVIDETLRKYPPVPVLQRECNRDFQLPNSDSIIPKGTQLQIPVWGLHMDPQYFPEPEKFDPDRFTDEEKLKRTNYAYLPFGEGPRNCIGMRFAQMQTRVGLVTLLSNYKFEVCEKTPVPLTYDPIPFVVSPKRGMYLRITPVNE